MTNKMTQQIPAEQSEAVLRREGSSCGESKFQADV